MSDYYLFMGTEEQRRVSQVVPKPNLLALTEDEMYVGDGETPLHSLRPATRDEIFRAVVKLCNNLPSGGWPPREDSQG